MRTNIVLIDYENVQPAALDLLADEHFRVVVFVGATQNKLPFELVATAQRLGDRMQYVKIAGVGRNALDVHIAYYLGKMAAEDATPFFHIISKDRGFDPLIQHLKEQNILSGRWPEVEEIPLVKAALTRSPAERAAAFLSTLDKPIETWPKTEKSLRSAVSAHFYKKLSDAEVSAVVAALEAGGALTMSNGKVAYATAG